MKIIDPNKLNIAVIQAQLAWENTDRNLQQFENSLQEITLEPVNLAVLPETFSTGFTMNVAENASTAGKSIDWMLRCARHYQLYIAGSLIFLENGKYRNRLCVADPEGNIEHYDKRHLYRMGKENKFFSAGNDRVIIKIGNFRILLQVCYDLRFPVFARNRDDYDIILYVANFPSSRENVWDTLLAARAIENQSYVIAANSCGVDGEGVENCGKSSIIDMKGIIKARLSNKPGIIQSSIQLDEIISFRDKFPAYLDADNFKLL